MLQRLLSLLGRLRPPAKPPTLQVPGPKALAMLRRFEGLRLQSYRDSVGVWTIGYGSTGPAIGPGLTWTTEQAETALLDKAHSFGLQIRLAVTAPLTQAQLDALVSLVYNIGPAAFKASTLLKRLNAGRPAEAADQFLRWNKGTVKGVKVEIPGLTTRRVAERAVFLGGTP